MIRDARAKLDARLDVAVAKLDSVRQRVSAEHAEDWARIERAAGPVFEPSVAIVKLDSGRRVVVYDTESYAILYDGPSSDVCALPGVYPKRRAAHITTSDGVKFVCSNGTVVFQVHFGGGGEGKSA